MQMTEPDGHGVFAISRPRRQLLTYYVVSSVLTGPLMPIVLAVKLARYRSLRYQFDDEGISMSWGVLFRREVHLTYGRIQDIHLASNVLERYLGLARIQIQTASGAAGAEMTLEGLEDPSVVRDFVYGRMGRIHLDTAGSAKISDPQATGISHQALASALGETSAALNEVASLLEELADDRRSDRRPPC